MTKLNLEEFYKKFGDFEEKFNDDGHNIKIEIKYRPFSNNQGEVVGVTEVYNTTCLDCGETEEIVNQVFTNGDEDLEIFAFENGYRDEDICGDCYNNEDYSQMLQDNLIELIYMKPQS